MTSHNEMSPRGRHEYRPQPPAPPQPPMMVVPRSVGAALALGLFLPGVGNMYAGRPGKGAVILACTLVAWVSTAVVIGFLLAPACHVWGAWTASNDARRWNQAHGIIS